MTITPNKLRGLKFAAAGIASIFAFGIAGCNGCASNSGTAAPITTATAPDAAAEDGNLAPVSGQPTTAVLGQSASYTPQQQGESYAQQPAPIERSSPGSSDQDYSYNAPPADNSGAGEDTNVDLYAQQPPPPLPEYQQPPAPEDDYLWTPGYWGYANTGYYWVPGVWCPPPYYGALWTPPYWGYYGGRYGFHHGYWGPHIGFYGGVDYGFGYIGVGFFGGYWHGHDFYYNRSVTNVNVNVVHNVYNHEVVYNNVHYGPSIVNRVSYNGGRGGINVAPRPNEIAAMRETHTPALHEQVQIRQSAATNRAQFYNQNHGAPAQVAVARPPQVSHQIGEPPAAVRQEQQRSATIQQHNAELQHAPAGAPNRAAEPQRAPEAARPNAAPAERGSQPTARPTQPQQRPAQPEQRAVQPEQRPTAQPQRAAPQARPAAPVERPQPEARPQPQPRQEAPRQQAAPQPRPEPRPEPQNPVRVAPQPHPEAAPAPRPAPAAAPRPAPAPHPAPAARPPQGHEGRPPV